MNVIEARAVVKRYGDFTAVDGVSFMVESGEFFGLLGPNGAGKTSAIRMMYGFSPVTSGQMLVFGLDIQSDWRPERKVKHDDLGGRIIVYAEANGTLQSEVREKFCSGACLFRTGNLEDVFLRLTGRELRE
jgi:ABC-type multidrug transport system ATPase subunit